MRNKPQKPWWEFCKNCGAKFYIDSQEILYKYIAHKKVCQNGEKGDIERVKRIFEFG